MICKVSFKTYTHLLPPVTLLRRAAATTVVVATATMKELAPTHSLPANSTTVSLYLSNESCPEHFKSNTIQINIDNEWHPNLRGHIIRELISDKPTLLLNYGRGDTWYFSSDAYDVTKLHNTIKTHRPNTLKWNTEMGAPYT